MTPTTSWSQRVGEIWTNTTNGTTVEIIGDHTHARLVRLRGNNHEEWVPYATLEANYQQACCPTCAMPLTGMRKLLIEEAERNRPVDPPTPKTSTYVKATPGTYCTKPCCNPRHAPRTC